MGPARRRSSGSAENRQAPRHLPGAPRPVSCSHEQRRHHGLCSKSRARARGGPVREHAGWVVEWPENQRDPIGFRSRPYGVLLRDRWIGAPTLLWAEQRGQDTAIWALPVREGGKKRPVAFGQGFASSPLVAMPDGVVGWGLGHCKTLVSDFQDEGEGHPKRVQHKEDGELFSSSQSGEYVAVLLENGRALVRVTLGEQLQAPKRSEQPSTAETPAIPEVEDAGP